MQARLTWVLGALLSWVGACGGDGGSAPETDAIATGDGDATLGDGDADGTAVGGHRDTAGGGDGGDVQAMQIDGAWVFVHEPWGGDGSPGGGDAAVVDGCLLIGDAVVIWDASQLDAVRDVLALLEDGVPVRVRMGGGGISLDDGGSLEQFPDAVRAHCHARALWFTSPALVAVERR